jgi:hypothetical protein
LYPFFCARARIFSGGSARSVAVGVCSNPPYPIASVGCADTRSWKDTRPNFVPHSFQVSAHLLEDHPSIPIKQAANIFAHNEGRGNL